MDSARMFFLSGWWIQFCFTLHLMGVIKPLLLWEKEEEQLTITSLCTKCKEDSFDLLIESKGKSIYNALVINWKIITITKPLPPTSLFVKPQITEDWWWLLPAFSVSTEFYITTLRFLCNRIYHFVHNNPVNHKNTISNWKEFTIISPRTFYCVTDRHSFRYRPSLPPPLPND